MSATTIERLIASPISRPAGFVEKNASNIRPVGGIDALAAILHLDDVVARHVVTRGHGEEAGPSRKFGHRVAGVEKQVDQYLLQLHAVAKDRR